jgi:capsule polysaccharide export protein KpsE/RkpR
MGISETKMDYYGESEDIDRLFSLARSSELRGKMIEHFSLYDHYKIDPDSKFADYNVQKKLKKAFTIEKTKYDALRIAIECTNPILSRDMTNYARDYVNAKAQELIKDSQEKLLKTSESNIKLKDNKINELNKDLDSLRNKYSIYDTKSQGEIIATLLTKLQSNLVNVQSKKNSYKGINQDSVKRFGIREQALIQQLSSIKKQAANYNAGLAKVVSLEKQQTEASDQLGIDKERFKLLKSAYENDFNGVHVVEFANKPSRKSRPKRSILVMATCVATFFFLCLGVILLSFYKQIDWKEISKNA